MRFLLVFLVLVPLMAADRSAALAALKKQFPAHIAGPVTEKTHPEVQVMWEIYRNIIDRMTLESMPKDLVRLSHKIDYDTSRADDRAADSRNPFGSAGRNAARQNAQWLRQKVTPYLRRLVQFQKGA